MTVKDTTEPGVPILAGPTPVPVPASDPENPVLASSTPASVDNASTPSAPVPASVPPLMQPAVVKSVAASAPPPSAAAKVVHPGAGAGAGGAVHRAPKFGSVPVKVKGPCKHCGESGKLTTITSEPSGQTYCCCCLLCLTLWPIAWLPFVIPGCQKVTHNCGGCGNVVGSNST